MLFRLIFSIFLPPFSLVSGMASLAANSPLRLCYLEQKTTTKAFPWWKSLGNCSATEIAPHLWITAAHCVVLDGSERLGKEKIHCGIDVSAPTRSLLDAAVPKPRPVSTKKSLVLRSKDLSIQFAKPVETSSTLYTWAQEDWAVLSKVGLPSISPDLPIPVNNQAWLDTLSRSSRCWFAGFGSRQLRGGSEDAEPIRMTAAEVPKDTLYFAKNHTERWLPFRSEQAKSHSELDGSWLGHLFSVTLDKGYMDLVPVQGDSGGGLYCAIQGDGATSEKAERVYLMAVVSGGTSANISYFFPTELNPYLELQYPFLKESTRKALFAQFTVSHYIPVTQQKLFQAQPTANGRLF